MSDMHPRYREAKNRLRDLTQTRPSLFDQTITLGNQWREALLKDDTGFNCVLMVDDLIERMTPMRK
jgi:hypothetical protein